MGIRLNDFGIESGCLFQNIGFRIGMFCVTPAVAFGDESFPYFVKKSYSPLLSIGLVDGVKSCDPLLGPSTIVKLMTSHDYEHIYLDVVLTVGIYSYIDNVL